MFTDLEGWDVRPMNILDDLRADRIDPVEDDRYWAAFDRAVQVGLVDRYGAAKVHRLLLERLGRAPAAPAAPVVAVDAVEEVLDGQPSLGVRSFDLTDFSKAF